MEKLILFCRDECLSRLLFARMSCALVFFCSSSSCLQNFPSRYERRGDLLIEVGSDWNTKTR